ncbi:MAG: pyruvate kinase, partial [Rhodobacteraceae bacterium]|nr:pyruvate kinase [Paracoccaceae bacterium]
IQKRLVRGARAAAKPVIVATQMLESMIESPVPTRAEVSDVATAIYEGADAVMLSAESAAGKYPVEAVTTMNNVAISVESDPTFRAVIEASRARKHDSVADAIVAAAREIAEASDIKAICVFSQSGNTVNLVARERPRVPIIALTPLLETARRTCLTWGAHCVITEEQDRFKGAVIAAVRAARTHGFAQETDQIVLTAGVPFNVQGSTNILRVAPCDERLIHRVDPE